MNIIHGIEYRANLKDKSGVIYLTMLGFHQETNFHVGISRGAGNLKAMLVYHDGRVFDNANEGHIALLENNDWSYA